MTECCVREKWRKYGFKRAMTALCFAGLSMSVSAEDGALQAEHSLLSGLVAVKTASFDQAVSQAQTLAKDMPEYKLAQLVKAELYAIRAGKADWVEQQRRRNQREAESLLSEAKVRWQQQENDGVNQNTTWDALLTQYVLKTSDEPYLVIVDSEAHRLFLYRKNENGYQEVVNYYVTLGEKGTGKQVRGDMKTPIGIYRIEKELPDSKLPELYGVAALTLDYPNSWDKQKGRTGSGIWLHGTPRDTFSRAPLASRGCVVLNNPAMETLVFKYGLLPSTPVIIAQNIERNFIERNDESKQLVLSQINQWLRSQNDYHVDWAQVSVYAYPGEKGVYYVSFPVDDGRRLVEQYWQRQTEGRWQLVFETEQESKNAPKVSKNLALSSNP